ncbi:MAG: DUF983 domain-containing protein [Bdellovibrionota bacterium]
MNALRSVTDLLGNKCPHCRNGKVFSSLFSMNSNCPTCGFKFEREPGYFTGAMAFSYIIGFFTILPTFLWMIYSGNSLFYWIAVPSAELIILSPWIYRYSRLLWLYADPYRNK